MHHFSVQVQAHDDGFAHVIDDLRQRLAPLSASSLLLHIYSTVFSVQTLSELVAALRGAFPGCQIVCRTVSGGVMDYEYQPGILVAAEAFERQNSHAEAHAYDLTDSSDRAVACEIARFVGENPWVKAVEVHRTVHDMNTSDLCEVLSRLPKEIEVFGGIVSAAQVPGNLSYLANQSGEIMDKGLVAVYYGGSDLHIKACRMSGWRPIDKYFTVTRAEGNVIKEINGAPAYDIYRRYLDIEPDDAFVRNVLEFPLLSEERGNSVVRNVFGLDPDGGFIVAYDVRVGTRLKISYADAATIAEGIDAVSAELMEFAPDVVSVVSCITRSMIWQMNDFQPELQGFRTVAPCHGSLSHGEFLREGGVLSHHNTILVAAAFREGEAQETSGRAIPKREDSAAPLTARLSTFISRVTDELKDMYSEMEHAVTTDALTQIGNRYLFDNVFHAASIDAAHADTKYLLMFDLNELKFVNDTYGHSEGDALIRTAARTIERAFTPCGQCFRIGGDEFAAIVDYETPDALQAALKAFHASVREHNRQSPYPLSIAVGHSPLINAEGKMMNPSEWRSTADIDMYRDKARFHAIKPNALSTNMIDFISCTMSLLDNKNVDYAYHSERVQRISMAIAERMGLDEDLLERIKVGSYLHDIGRIGVPDEMLSKADPFSDNDRPLLKRLPSVGRRLLLTSEETKGIANIVYACFERWDGSGCPEGLAGEEIPVEARIIAVADFIDIALHERSDKPAVTVDACIQKLKEESGAMFDPAVIALVIANFDDVIAGSVA